MRTYRFDLVTHQDGLTHVFLVGNKAASREGAEDYAMQRALDLIGVSTRWTWSGNIISGDRGAFEGIVITDTGPAQWDGDYTGGKR